MDTEDSDATEANEAETEAFWPGVRPPTVEAVDNLAWAIIVTATA